MSPWISSGAQSFRTICGVLSGCHMTACPVLKYFGHFGVSGLPQYEATKAYMPKNQDELSLRQAELVIVLQKEEGEALHAAPTPLPDLPPLRCSVLFSQSGAMGREWEMENGAGFLPAVPQRSPTLLPSKTTCSAWSACAKRPTFESSVHLHWGRRRDPWGGRPEPAQGSVEWPPRLLWYLP